MDLIASQPPEDDQKPSPRRRRAELAWLVLREGLRLGVAVAVLTQHEDLAQWAMVLVAVGESAFEVISRR
jgi:hypothetical protein